LRERANTVHAEAVGAGAREFVEGVTTARVVGRFRNGFYVGHRRQMFAVVGSSVCAGPLHLRTKGSFDVPSTDEAVALSSTMIRVGSLTISLESSRRYQPQLPRSLGPGTRWLERLVVEPSADLEAVLSTVKLAAQRGELAHVRELLCGRGRGLTPEGDDVFAGMLLVLAMRPGRRRSLATLVEGAKTTDLSREFLRWAAQGQSIDVAHEVLSAAAGLRHKDFRASVRSLEAIGASSGRAMMIGIRLASTVRGR